MGDIRVEVRGEVVPLGHRRQKAVLGALLIHPNRPHPASRIIERVWGEDAPSGARDALYVYMHHLRRGLAHVPGVGILRRSGGYLLTADETTIDLHRFQALVTQARTVDDRTALLMVEEALSLWRGEPLGDLQSPWAGQMRHLLEQRHLAARLHRNDLGLRLGHHHALLPTIADLAAAHPFDERITGQLMTALHHCGRRVDALFHYLDFRNRLAHDVGGRPGPALREVRRRILGDEPTDREPSTPAPRVAHSGTS